MKTFAYRAVHACGKIHQGTLAAENENALAFALGRRQLELIDAREKKNFAPRQASLPSRRVAAKDKAAFSSQMDDLLRAGIPLPQALELTLEACGEGGMRDAITALETSVRSGCGIAQALRAQNGLFDPIALALLETGERSGDLAQAFASLSAHLNAQETLRAALRRALRYPLFLMCVAGAATGFMLGWVVPQIVGFLASETRDLPFATRLLVASADAFLATWWIPLVAAGFCFVLIKALRRVSESMARAVDGLVLNIPFFGPLNRALALARFMQGLALLLKNGAPLLDSLRACAHVLNNRALEAQVEKAREALLSGASFSVATMGFFPPFVSKTLKISERSGAFLSVLEETARTTEKRVNEKVRSFLGALEPALTSLVGGVLAWVVLAVLGPLYASLGSLSGGL